MSEHQNKGDLLPQLQKRIILNLAKNEPQNVYETMSALKGSYHATWNAFSSLQKKKLIRVVYRKMRRGKNSPHYWLTDEGIMTAVMEDANSAAKLLATTKRLFPDNKTAHLFLEIATSFHPEVMKIALASVKAKHKLGLAEILMLYLAQPEIAGSEQALEKFTDTLEKYPDEYSRLKTAAQLMIETLSKLVTK
jgi:hypothetical protein